MPTTHLTTLEDTHDFAEAFISDISNSREHIVALSGDLGAGKTTFAKACGEVLGVAETIVSPTFVIAKFYEVPDSSGSEEKIFPWKQFVHIDAYRLESWSELEKLGFAEVFDDPETLIFIEWPEQVGDTDQSVWKVLSFEIEGDERVVSY